MVVIKYLNSGAIRKNSKPNRTMPIACFKLINSKPEFMNNASSIFLTIISLKTKLIIKYTIKPIGITYIKSVVVSISPFLIY